MLKDIRKLIRATEALVVAMRGLLREASRVVAVVITAIVLLGVVPPSAVPAEGRPSASVIRA